MNSLYLHVMVSVFKKISIGIVRYWKKFLVNMSTCLQFIIVLRYIILTYCMSGDKFVVKLKRTDLKKFRRYKRAKIVQKTFVMFVQIV